MLSPGLTFQSLAVPRLHVRQSRKHEHRKARINKDAETSDDLTAALYPPSNEMHITNGGTIRYHRGSGRLGGVALVSYEAPLNEVEDVALQATVGHTTLTNTGRIVGDSRMIDIDGLLDMASEASVYAKSQLNIAGRRESLIENSGAMQNIVLGAGSRKVSNSGTIAGSIRVNQNVIYYDSATNATKKYPAGTFPSGQPPPSRVPPGVPPPGCLPSRFYLTGDMERGYQMDCIAAPKCIDAFFVNIRWDAVATRL
jgi:hypothetical protein